MTKPLIYTSRGNMLEEDLEYCHAWVDDGRHLWMHERWITRDTGELVKNNVHGYEFQDITLKRLLKKWLGMFRRKSVGLVGQGVKMEGSL